MKNKKKLSILFNYREALVEVMISEKFGYWSGFGDGAEWFLTLRSWQLEALEDEILNVSAYIGRLRNKTNAMGLKQTIPATPR